MTSSTTTTANPKTKSNQTNSKLNMKFDSKYVYDDEETESEDTEPEVTKI